MIEKAKQVRLLVLDVDGVLTPGTIHFSENGDECKSFHLHDGLGIQLLQNAGIPVAIISGKQSRAVIARCEDLKIKQYYLGNAHKLPAYESLKTHYQLEDNQIAYMGDDLPDLPILKRVGLSVTVPQAPDIVKKHADMVTTHLGGDGAVREVCDFILSAQNKYESSIARFLEE
ncbi:MAG TPA: HAD-IIIA family hydrolase [Gammaproteobacteria bacterium]|jgi:3-deoxy-D-manno-octulosonate 8-phosphate phosphatase (KDO 8-P phosphatase)|nr:HAD-IIIA family hydrolase [Gammaproteobacteria bacterium]